MLDYNTRHFVIDIETLACCANPVITSIGVSSFILGPLAAREEIEEFYTDVDIQSCLDLGMKVDGSTISWWMKQDKKAQAPMAFAPGTSISMALGNLRSHISRVTEAHAKPYLVWGHATFDPPHLESAYRCAGIESLIPWKYNQPRDLRTLMPLVNRDEVRSIEFEGVKHHALDDARHEAKELARALDYLKTRGVYQC